MRIDRDGDDVSMVLSKQDMIDLKAMFDSHLLIPKYDSSLFGGSGGIPLPPMSKTLWPGVKSWYASALSGQKALQQQYPQPGQWQVVSSNPQSSVQPLPQAKVEYTHEILGKLIRAFDLILENKNTGGKEIE